MTQEVTKIFDWSFECPQVNSNRIDEYFSAWAINESHFRQMAARFDGTNLIEHVKHSTFTPILPGDSLSFDTTHSVWVKSDGQGDYVAVSDSVPEPQAAGGRRDYEMVRGHIAMIDVRGTLMKQASSFSGGSSTVAIRRAVRSAANDPNVEGILLVIDSPGGTVSGTFDLVEDIRKAADMKPTHAYIEDLGASAAYAIASATSYISMNATGSAGSIGTYMAIEDLSGHAEQLGIKVHVLKAGEFKGSGVPGTEITNEQLSVWQAHIDELNDHFLKSVAEGRKLSMKSTRELADGRVHIGQAAVDKSLVNAIGSIDDAVAHLSKKASSHVRRNKMASTSDVAAATVEQLESLPGVSSLDNKDGFILGQLKASASVADATNALLQELALKAESVAEQKQQQEKAQADAIAAAEAKAREEAEAKFKADAAAAAAAAPGFRMGADEDTTSEATSTDAVSEFETLLQDEIDRQQRRPGADAKSPNAHRLAALQEVHKKNPELHRDYIRAKNAGNPNARVLF